MTLDRDFTLHMDLVLDRMEEGMIEHIADHVVAFGAEIAHRTPKDTGTASRRWKTNVGSPSREQHVEPAPGAGVQESEQTIRGKIRSGSFKLGKSIFVSNAQLYIWRLEHGWGKNNPPSGFVRPAMAAYPSRLRKR